MDKGEDKTYLLPSGTILRGKYRIEDILGEGGFGITYRGEAVELKLRVAIKEYYPYGYALRDVNKSINIDPIPDEKSRKIFRKNKKSFLEEARKLAQCVHIVSVVGVYDYFEENQTAYIVMEYLDGITLKAYLQKNGPADATWLCRRILPLLEDLQKVHEQGVLHRDISPDNIMLMDRDRLKLMDFGAARDFDIDSEKSMTVMLKNGFAPFEQYTRYGVQGPWTDIYALSTTLYTCITGKIPDPAPDRMEHDELNLPSEMGIVIDPKIERVLARGLCVLSKDRYQSAAEMAEALEGAIYHEPNAAHVSHGERDGIENRILHEGQVESGKAVKTKIEEKLNYKKEAEENRQEKKPKKRIQNREEKTVLFEQGSKYIRRGAAVLCLAAAILIILRKNPEEKLQKEEANAFAYYIETPTPSPTDIEEIVIPDGVKAIRGSAFEASALKQITIPASVTEFEEDAFPKGLETIIGEKGSTAQELAKSLGITFEEMDSVSIHEVERIKHEQFENRRNILALQIEKQSEDVPLLKNDDSSKYISYRGNRDDTGWVSGIGLDSMVDIELPDYMNGNRIVGIDDSGLEACDLIRNVIVPEGITTFGYNAFRECSRLEHVSMPESLLAIHAGAFEHCVNLKEAIVPDSVSVIGQAAFNGCISLENVRLPKNLKTIESELFQLCENLERIDIPSGVISIKEWAFYHCEKLTTLNLPDSLIEIGDYAFSRCGSLEELLLPKSVESIGLYAFKNSGIKRIIVEDGMKVLDAAAILNTEGIDELWIPESVEQIKGGVFYSQGNIKRIVGIRGSVAYSLAMHLGIEFVEMEKDEQELPSKETTQLSEIPKRFILVDKSVLKYEVEEKLGMPETRFSRTVGSKDKLIGNVALPQNEGSVIVKEIGSWSFYNAKGITGVAIPEGIERIGSHAFYKCTEIEEIVLPSSLKYIDDYAFCDCKNLTSIIIPQSVEYIGTWAFGHCYKLKTILGVPGSAAEKLAKELRIEFQAIE